MHIIEQNILSWDDSLLEPVHVTKMKTDAKQTFRKMIF
jgi:hypothetical protein